MSVISENEINEKTLIAIAEKMAIAARTAPKGRGHNNIEIKLVTGKDIKKISDKMKEIGNKKEQTFFIRDAENILLSPVIFLIAAKVNAINLNCGLCGFKDCNSKNKFKEVPCAFNTIDIGIALGSAVGIASDNRVDNRIMYTIGQAVDSLNIFDKEFKIIFGVALTATSKNPFFDRK